MFGEFPFSLVFAVSYVSPQAGPPPVEIFTDVEEMSHDDYLRVTLHSTGPSFRGFLVKAVEVLNTDTQCNDPLL